MEMENNHHRISSHGRNLHRCGDYYLPFLQVRDIASSSSLVIRAQPPHRIRRLRVTTGHRVVVLLLVGDAECRIVG